MARGLMILLAGLLGALSLGAAAARDEMHIRVTASVARQCGVVSDRAAAGGTDLAVDCRGSVACVAYLRTGAAQALRRASGGCALSLANQARADEAEVQF